MPRIDLPGPFGSIEIPGGWRKPCRRAQWNEGVRAIAQAAAVGPPKREELFFFHDLPVSAVADGAGGAFVLASSAENWLWWTPGAWSVRHLSATGVASALGFIESPLNYVGIINIWSETAMVATSKRGVIVASADQLTIVAARAFDERGRKRWPRSPYGRALSRAPSPSTNGRVLNLVGEPDGNDGAIFAWRVTEVDGVLRTRAQRIRANGNLVWPQDGVILPLGMASRWPPPQPWLQLVGTGGGGAIVVAAEVSGAAFRLVAVDVTPTGSVGAATTIVASTPDNLTSLLRIRYAVPDRAGGLFLAYADAFGLRLLRYLPTQGVLWDNAIATSADARAFWIREDGRGGALVGWLDGAAARLALQRIDAQGAVTWTAGAGPQVAPVTIGLPPAATAWGRETWARLVHPMPDGGGGALVVFQSWADGAPQPELWSCCFRPDGTLVNEPLPVSSRTTGKSLPVATTVASESAIVAWADDGNIAVEGFDCWAQRIACCPPQQEQPPPPPFGCEILPLGGTTPGEIAFQLPCGNETWSFGVIPLSRFLDALPGVAAPGALVHRCLPPPAWVRMTLLGLPAGCDAKILTLGGRTLAPAKPIGSSRRKSEPPAALALTFRPPRGRADLLVLLSRPRANGGDAPVAFRVRVESGEGRVPPLPKPPPRKAATRRPIVRAARSAAKKKATAKHARRGAH
jgi:hypothetical protein